MINVLKFSFVQSFSQLQSKTLTSCCHLLIKNPIMRHNLRKVTNDVVEKFDDINFFFQPKRKVYYPTVKTPPQKSWNGMKVVWFVERVRRVGGLIKQQKNSYNKDWHYFWDTVQERFRYFLRLTYFKELVYLQLVR